MTSNNGLERLAENGNKKSWHQKIQRNLAAWGAKKYKQSQNGNGDFSLNEFILQEVGLTAVSLYVACLPPYEQRRIARLFKVPDETFSKYSTTRGFGLSLATEHIPLLKGASLLELSKVTLGVLANLAASILTNTARFYMAYKNDLEQKTPLPVPEFLKKRVHNFANELEPCQSLGKGSDLYYLAKGLRNLTEIVISDTRVPLRARIFKPLREGGYWLGENASNFEITKPLARPLKYFFQEKSQPTPAISIFSAGVNLLHYGTKWTYKKFKKNRETKN